MRERAAKREPRLIIAVQHADVEPCFLPRELEKLIAIAGIADGARRDDLGAFDAELLSQSGHSAEHNQRILNCHLAQHSALVQSRAESWRRLHFIDDSDDAG